MTRMLQDPVENKAHRSVTSKSPSGDEPLVTEMIQLITSIDAIIFPGKQAEINANIPGFSDGARGFYGFKRIKEGRYIYWLNTKSIQASLENVKRHCAHLIDGQIVETTYGLDEHMIALAAVQVRQRFHHEPRAKIILTANSIDMFPTLMPRANFYLQSPLFADMPPNILDLLMCEEAVLQLLAQRPEPTQELLPVIASLVAAPHPDALRKLFTEYGM